MAPDKQQVGKRKAFAARIDQLINESPKTQLKIAEEMGYSNPNIITMFKSGATRVPLEKVVPLAEVLGVDPAELLRQWFEAYMPPEVLPQIERFMGVVLSRAEESWIRNLRKVLGTLPPYRSEWAEVIKKLVAP